jgi:hypothetical protein
MTEKEFEAYETMILSDQIPQERVPSLLDQNPEFAEWYRDRARQRAIRPATTRR